MDIVFDTAGLVPAIAQDRLTGQVRMLGYMNRASIEQTLTSGRATFFSRSRGRIWEKGETSGNTLVVRALYADCDADALLLVTDPFGPTCHTGAASCFFRRADERGAADAGQDVLPALSELERTIAARKRSSAAQSYTRALLDGGAGAIGAKIREEADELARAVSTESDARVTSEAADVLYHVLVGLASRDVPLRDVLAELARRAGTSGHDEKASRERSP